jgi:hypothetical protein
MNKDSMILGAILGLVAPIGGMLIYYSLFLSHHSIATVIERTMSDGKITSMVSLGCFANLALFFLFYKMELDKSARGVILATFVYVAYVMYVKFI